MRTAHKTHHRIIPGLTALTIFIVAVGGAAQSVALPIDPDTSGGGVWSPGQGAEPGEALAVARLDALEEEGEGRWSAARRRWGDATRVAPMDEEAILGHARTLVAEGRPWDAALFLDQQTRGRSDSPHMFRAAGDAALASGSPGMAVDSYARAVQIDIDNPDYRAAWAWALHLSGRHADVITALADQSMTSIPTAMRRALALSALEVGDSGRASEALRSYLLSEPGDDAARLDLARAELLNGRDTEAYAALSAYLAVKSEDPAGWTLLGHVRLRVGQPDLALQCYVAAVERGADARLLAPLMDRARLSAEVFGGVTAAPAGGAP